MIYVLYNMEYIAITKPLKKGQINIAILYVLSFQLMPFNIALTVALFIGWTVASIGYIMEKK